MQHNEEKAPLRLDLDQKDVLIGRNGSRLSEALSQR